MVAAKNEKNDESFHFFSYKYFYQNVLAYYVKFVPLTFIDLLLELLRRN